MKNRTALVAVVAAILAAPAGRASTPCDALPNTNKVTVSPEKIGDALCNACVGLPVPGKRDPLGNGLDYNDGAKHWECEMMVRNRGNGQCKRQTTCLPGGERFDDNGVFRCRYPAVVATAPNTPANPREACERSLKVSISRVKDRDGIALPNNVIYRSAYPAKLLLEGDGVANGVSATIGGGIIVSIGDAARRVGSTPFATCLPPNCQVVSLDNLANAQTGRQTLTLFTPHQFASASVDLYVSLPPTPAPVSVSALRQPIGPPTGGVPAPAPTLTPTRTPTPRAARDQGYSAGLGCPGGQTSSTNVSQAGGPSQVFEIRSAQVQATAGAQWLNSRTIDGVPICTWEGAYQFVIKALDGQGDVTVSWNAQHNNAYSNPLALSTSQPVTLTRGRWQIVPDGTFPVDFTYTVSFRD